MTEALWAEFQGKWAAHEFGSLMYGESVVAFAARRGVYLDDPELAGVFNPQHGEELVKQRHVRWTGIPPVTPARQPQQRIVRRSTAA